MKPTVVALSAENAPSQAKRAGVVATCLAALTLGSGCASIIKDPLAGVQPTPNVAPFDPVAAARAQEQRLVLREVDVAERAARDLGMENFVYLDSKRATHTISHNAQNIVGTSEGFETYRSTVIEKGSSVTFSMKALNDWGDSQVQELLARPQVRELLTTPRSGVLLSIDGKVAVVDPSGKHAWVAPVRPFIAATAQR